MGKQGDTIESLEQVADSVYLLVFMGPMPCRKGPCSKDSGENAFFMKTSTDLIRLP